MGHFLARWRFLSAMKIVTMMLIASCSDVFQTEQQELAKLAARSLAHIELTVASEFTDVGE